MPSESSPLLPLAYEKGSPLTARDRSSDVLQSRTRLVFLNSVPHPERDSYLRFQIHYTDPSVPVEVEAQAKPAGGSRGCKVIKQKTGAVPDGLLRQDSQRVLKDTMALARRSAPNCVSLQVRTTTPRRPRGRRAAVVVSGVRLVGREA